MAYSKTLKRRQQENPPKRKLNGGLNHKLIERGDVHYLRAEELAKHNDRKRVKRKTKQHSERPHIGSYLKD